MVRGPFTKLFNQGMVCQMTYKTEKGLWVYPEYTYLKDGQCFASGSNEKVVTGSSKKMSKSKRNIVNPKKKLDAYGADAVRMFMVSYSPTEKDIEWTDTGIKGLR